MSAENLKGTLVNTGDLTDFRAFGPAMVQDPQLLDSPSFGGILTWIAYRKASGLLTLSNSTGGQFALSCKDGNLVTLERQGLTFMDEVLNHLVVHEVISAEDGAKAQAGAEQGGRSVLQLLFESGACTPRALVEAIRVTKHGILDQVLELTTASFQWDEGSRSIPSSDPVTIDINLYLVKLLRERARTAYFSELEPYLNPYLGRYPMKSDTLTPAVSGVSFSDKERRILEEIADGTITLKEVMSVSLLSRNMTARLFFTAAVLGFVSFRRTALPKGGIEALELELERTLERVNAEDHFTRLETHWTSHPSKLSGSYEAMVERYGSANKKQRQSEKAAELSDAILALMKESFDLLSEPDIRRNYRKEIMDESKLIFGTDFLFKQAHLAKFRGEIVRAKEIIESAIDILPRQKFIDFRRSLGQG